MLVKAAFTIIIVLVGILGISTGIWLMFESAGLEFLNILGCLFGYCLATSSLILAGFAAYRLWED